MVLPAKLETLRVQRVWASMSNDCSQLVKMASQNKKVLSLTLDTPGSNTLPNDSWQHFRLYTPLCKELIMSRVNLEGQGESTVLWVTLWAFIFPVSLLMKNMPFVFILKETSPTPWILFHTQPLECIHWRRNESFPHSYLLLYIFSSPLSLFSYL